MQRFVFQEAKSYPSFRFGNGNVNIVISKIHIKCTFTEFFNFNTDTERFKTYKTLNNCKRLSF